MAYFFPENVLENLQKVYRTFTIPVQCSISQPSSPILLDEMFVELRLQEFDSVKFPETPAYRDVEEIQLQMQSNEPIIISELFDVLHNNVAPRNVLIRGKAGVGKTTLAKHIAKRWADAALWKDMAKFLFVVTLRDLSRERKFNLCDLLLGGLPMSEKEQTLVPRRIRENSDKIVIILEGLDELTGYKYDKVERHYHEKVDVDTLISSILGDVMLPGSKVIVTSRPNDQLPSEVFHRVAELYGFPEENIKEYVGKFSDKNSELQRFILSHLQDNVNMMTLCYVPIQCNFVCTWLKDIHARTQSGHRPAINTTTELYVYATTELYRKHSLSLKCNVTHLDSKKILDVLRHPLAKHAELAKQWTVTPRLRLAFYEEDLHNFSDEDKHSGFLSESLASDQITEGRRRKCWSFTHLTFQEFMAAIGMLRGTRESILELIRNKRYVWQHEILLTFMAGLLGDPKNEQFKKCLGIEDNSLECREYIMELATKTTDHLKLVTLVYEAQLPRLVDIVPRTIKSSKVYPRELMSLSWVLKQPQCPITCLR